MGMFSDDEMMEVLVLKGGNALDLIYRISNRASVDVDLSMADDLPGGADAFRQRAESALTRTYEEAGYTAFDFKLVEKPKTVSDDLKEFWGGYKLTFKLLTHDDAKRLTDIEGRRRGAINLGQGPTFEIEISRFEFVEPKISHTLQGIVVFAYSPAMILAEKLRALCQQTPEYCQIVHRSYGGTSRAKDFIDIHVLATECNVDITTEENRQLLKRVFEAKKVPQDLLGKIAGGPGLSRSQLSRRSRHHQAWLPTATFRLLLRLRARIDRPIRSRGAHVAATRRCSRWPPFREPSRSRTAAATLGRA